MFSNRQSATIKSRGFTPGLEPSNTITPFHFLLRVFFFSTKIPYRLWEIVFPPSLLKEKHTHERTFHGRRPDAFLDAGAVRLPGGRGGVGRGGWAMFVGSDCLLSPRAGRSTSRIHLVGRFLSWVSADLELDDYLRFSFLAVSVLIHPEEGEHRC